MSATRLTRETNGFRVTITVDVQPLPHHYDLDQEDQRDQEEERHVVNGVTYDRFGRIVVTPPTDAELEQSIMEASAADLEEIAKEAGECKSVYELADEAEAQVVELERANKLSALGAPEPAQVEPLDPPEETSAVLRRGPNYVDPLGEALFIAHSQSVPPLEVGIDPALPGADHTVDQDGVEIVTREMAELRALQATEKKLRKTKASPRPPAPDPDEKPDAAAEESKQDRMLRSELALKIPIGERHLGVSAKERVDGREHFGHSQTLQKWLLADLQVYYEHLKDTIRQKETTA